LNAKKETPLLELVTLMVCDTGAPPACAEKLSDVGETLSVWASSPAAANRIRIEPNVKDDRFKRNLQIGWG